MLEALYIPRSQKMLSSSLFLLVLQAFAFLLFPSLPPFSVSDSPSPLLHSVNVASSDRSGETGRSLEGVRGCRCGEVGRKWGVTANGFGVSI